MFAKKRICLFCFLLVLLLCPIFAENATDEKPVAENSAEETQKNDEEVSSQYQDRLEKIQFGIDSEICDLIDVLVKDEDFVYSDELFSLFETTRSLALREKIIEYYTASKDPRLTEYVANFLQDPYDEAKSTATKVFSYVSELKIKEALEPTRSLLKNENEDYMQASIVLLGKIGEEEDAELLEEYLEKDIPAATKEAVVVALGELKAESSFETLLGIAKDSNESTGMRMNAVEALGKFENPLVTDELIKMYEDTDSNFRLSVVKGLATQTDEKSQKLIIEAIKDSYYRIRIAAIEAAQKQKLVSAVPSIIYRSKNDSEAVVKNKTYEALAEIGDSKGIEYLLDLLKNEKQSDDTRGRVASALLKHQFELSIGDVVKVVETTLDDDKHKNLRYSIGKEFAKYNNPELEYICGVFLEHKDVSTKGTGLDIYAKNAFTGLTGKIEEIANNKKEGANQKKARYILDKQKQQNSES